MIEAVIRYETPTIIQRTGYQYTAIIIGNYFIPSGTPETDLV